MTKLPEILQRRILSPEEVSSRGLRIEQLHLKFSNGNERYYQRIRPVGGNVVLIVPMPDNETVLLIREYAAGLHNYQLQLPKGAIEPDETLLSAANRELKEEVGKGAHNLLHINTFSAIPGFNPQLTDIVLARDLYDEQLSGDEPEAIEVVPWSINELAELVQREDCTEARTIAALYYVRDLLLMNKI